MWEATPSPMNSHCHPLRSAMIAINPIILYRTCAISFSMTSSFGTRRVRLVSTTSNNQLDRQSSALVGRIIDADSNIFRLDLRVDELLAGHHRAVVGKPPRFRNGALARIRVCIDDDGLLARGRLVVVDKSRDRLRLIAFDPEAFIAETDGQSRRVGRQLDGGLRGLRLAASDPHRR